MLETVRLPRRLRERLRNRLEGRPKSKNVNDSGRLLRRLIANSARRLSRDSG